MPRFLLSTIGVLSCALLCMLVAADDPPKKLTEEERKKLAEKLEDLNAAMRKAQQAKEFSDARKAGEEAVGIARLLYSKDQFPGGHVELAKSLNNLALLYQAQTRYADAEPLFRETLAIMKQLYKGDHFDVAFSLNNLALVYQYQAKYSDSEPLLRESLEMKKRLLKGDHPTLTNSLNNLSHQCFEQSKFEDAERFTREALDMNKLMFKGDHPEVATCLYNLGVISIAQGKYREAEPFYRDAFEIRKRLYMGDHLDVAYSLGGLADLYKLQGKYADSEPLFREALEMRRRLFKGDHLLVTFSMHNLADLYKIQGRYSDAEVLIQKALAIRKSVFKGDHPLVAASLTELASLYREQGNFADGEMLVRDALAMNKRLLKGDHLNMSVSLGVLADLCKAQGKYTEAESLARDTLDMHKRLFKGDNLNVARSLNNLAIIYMAQRKFAPAEPLVKEALEMFQRLFKEDHDDVARCLENLATLYKNQEQYVNAESLYRKCLEMNKRLFNRDHPFVLHCLTELATLYRDQGKNTDAEALFLEVLTKSKRLYEGDHPLVATALNNLAIQYQAQGKHAEAKPLFRQALGMYGRVVQSFATRKAEGEALTLLAAMPFTRDAFLSATLAARSDPQEAYSEIWFSKGLVTRVYEQRQLTARAAATSSAARQSLTELATARQQRAELLLASYTHDAPTIKQRKEQLENLEIHISELNKAIKPLLSAVEHAGKLSNSASADLQKVLPSDSAVVDYLRFVNYEQLRDKTGKINEKSTVRYLAFVIKTDGVTWVILDDAAKIEEAVAECRRAITSGGSNHASILGQVRELVWEKVRKELPANIKTVYISPDAALCRLPWAALPGDRTGTILLDDYAIATIPHAQFLLEKFWPQDPLKNPPNNALVVGGVKYETETLHANATSAESRANPLLKPDARIGWSFLPGSVWELNGVWSLAQRKKISTTRLQGENATPSAVLAALPEARIAHFATHGFFADPSFRGIFQLDEKEYEKSWRGERIGRAAKSPLIMTGLVFAGANNPKTPGRGILTGESLIDLDLSGLELAVLSACETGLGDVAGGEGTFGLQRAFHMAGTRNVIASLWKVPDQSTAALMALFYQNLWEKNLSPMESLRQAQLEIYKNPGKIGELAKGFRGQFQEVSGKGEVEIKPGGDGKAHPLLWAAFTLSGPGK
jgi:CHAT domain-containing protein